MIFQFFSIKRHKKEKKKVWQLPTFPPLKAVSSALESLTSVFGMGTGIASPLWPPDIHYLSFSHILICSSQAACTSI